jgi:hypothetical protein
VAGVALRELSIGWMNPSLGGRHGEDEPTSADVDGAEFKNIAEEGAVSLGVFAIQKKMSADNHGAEYIPE